VGHVIWKIQILMWNLRISYYDQEEWCLLGWYSTVWSFSTVVKRGSCSLHLLPWRQAAQPHKTPAPIYHINLHNFLKAKTNMNLLTQTTLPQKW
jgi:hypothetical protein